MPAQPDHRLGQADGANGWKAVMSGAVAHGTNVLPMPARRRSEPRWPSTDRPGAPGEAADGGLESETEGAPLLEGCLDEDFDAAAEDGPLLPAAQARPHAAPGAAARRTDAADDATMAAWITRIAHQDERALASLYDATAARLHGLVLRITQRAALAEEVLEDTFWQVWRQAPRFDGERGRPVTWLLAMARSRAIDALRREQRHQHDALPEDDSADAAGLCDGRALPPQDLLEATRGHAHVHAALASLDPRSRQLVSLAFFRGLTHEEIAAQQGLPLGTVKSLVRRALQQLRRVMEAEHA